MDYLAFDYKWKSRDLRKIIVTILKMWLANSVKSFNYVKDYSLDDWKVQKSEEKILLICTQDQDKLLFFLNKNFPQIEKININ